MIENTIEQKYGGELTEWSLKRDAINNGIRVAIPGIVRSYNALERTVTVKPAIREVLHNKQGKRVNIALPELLDVPVIMPHAGGFNISFPVKAGDECLIVFADMCIDAWWQSGGVQNQIEQRRHDLSDGFAILGPFSQTNKSGSVGNNLVIEHTATNTSIVVKASGGVEINGNLTVNGTINGRVI